MPKISTLKLLYQYQCNMLGHDDLNAITTLHKLSFLLGQTGNYLEAYEMQKRVYKKRRELFELNNSDTLESLNNLAFSCWQIDKNDESIELY